MVQLYSKVTDMNKDNDISNDDVSEYNNYNLNKCLEEYYDDDNIVHNKINSIEMDIFDEMNGSNLSMKSVVKKKKKWKKFVLIFLALVFIVVLGYSLLKILFWFKDNMDMSSVIKEISENIEVEEVIDDENTELVNEEENELSDYWYYITFPLINVDIGNLKVKNKDTVGWINVNNTNINYPFVQANDNNYYLNHSFDNSVNKAGWVFLDYRNDNNLSDKNNIIYAHSRLDKTMFGSLNDTLKYSWYSNKDNHIIKISTEKENTLWQIFSVYKIPVESYYITTDFLNDSAFEDFLDVIKKRSVFDFNTNLTKDDRILTLSTCYSDKERTVIHAKLIKRSLSN